MGMQALDSKILASHLPFDLAEHGTYMHAVVPTLSDEAMPAIRSLLSGVTHAMSNMVMPLCEYPQIIARMVPEGSPAVGMLTNLGGAAQRLADLNEGLIQLCHGQEGTPSSVTMSALARQVRADLLDLCPDDRYLGIDLDLADEDLPLQGPHDALYQALHHLCRNAMEAMPEAGTITLRVATLANGIPGDSPLAALPAGPCVCVQVRDIGPGVHEAYREHLFDPFCSSIRGEGRGLGLSHVYRTVCHMNGAILFNPDCDPGADFLLFFPVSAS